MFPTFEFIKSDMMKLFIVRALYEQHRAKRRQYEAEYRKANGERLKNNQHRYNKTEKSKQRLKRYSELHPDRIKETQSNYNSSESGRSRARRYFTLNHDKVLEAQRKYARSEKGKLKDAKYRVSEKRRAWYRNRWRTDVNFKLSGMLRLLLRQAIKGRSANQRALKLLGCSLDDFRARFESMFTPGMTWDAFMRGEIHIDHIRPISSFDLTNPVEVAECFSHANMQPLWSVENIRKGCKVLT